jgi:hypothetical protein
MNTSRQTSESQTTVILPFVLALRGQHFFNMLFFDFEVQGGRLVFNLMRGLE